MSHWLDLHLYTVVDLKMTSKIAWRFSKKPLSKLRVAFAGRHFPACFPRCQQILKERQLQDRIEVIQAPYHADLISLAPSIHVAIPFMEKFTSDFIRGAPNLRLIQQQGVGLEGVDVQAATQEGVAVCNIPANTGTVNAESTAEHALLLTMMLLRSMHQNLPQRFRSGSLGGLQPLPRTLYGQRVTVVGYGAVGSTLCDYLTTLQARVTAVRKRPWEAPTSSSTKSPASNIKQSNCLEDELPTTDVLILCCTMTPETHHLLSNEFISLLPPGALVVNVGRGPLVEYRAIYDALQRNHVAGFASDVGVGHATKPAEPWDPTDPLSQHPNTIFTPHVGGNCDVVVTNMADIIVNNLELVLDGKPPRHWTNKDDRG